METVKTAAGRRRPVTALALCLLASGVVTRGLAQPSSDLASVVRSGGDFELHWTQTAPGGVDIAETALPDSGSAASGQPVAIGVPGHVLSLPVARFGPHPIFRIAPHDGGAVEFAAPRVVPLQGQSNLRDLGGYRTADGREVRWGLIYRSGELSHLTADDYATLTALHIHTVCDLRTGTERAAQPTRWAAGPIQTLVSPKPQLDSVLKPLLAMPDPTAADVRAMMTDFYRKMPELYAEEYRAIFRQILDGRTPLLFHCTAGKDRSGVAAALILSALGVARPTVEQDYQLTESLQKRLFLPTATPAMARLQGLSPEARTALMRADPAYVDAALDAIVQRYGSLDGYLQTRLGVGPVEKLRLREALLY